MKPAVDSKQERYILVASSILFMACISILQLATVAAEIYDFITIMAWAIAIGMGAILYVVYNGRTTMFLVVTNAIAKYKYVFIAFSWGIIHASGQVSRFNALMAVIISILGILLVALRKRLT